MRTARLVAVFAAIGVAWGTAPGALEAQEPPDSVDVIPLAPLTVTVLRTPIRSDRAPYAVEALRRAEADRARPGLGLDEALRGVPGIQVDNRYNDALGERISVRGFGARSQFGVRGVKVVVDGIPATLPDGQTTLNHVDLGSLGRVEVVRGPASALWGNAAGGVLQLETEPPPLERFRQHLEATVGAHGLLRLSSTTGGRDGETSYRVAVSRVSTDGHREWNAAERLHANAQLGHRIGANALRFTANVVRYDARNPGSLSALQLAEDRTQANGGNLAQRTGEEGLQGQLGLVWRRALGGGELEVSAYGIAKRLENPIPPTIIELDRRAGGARAILHGSSALAGRELRWAAGVEAEVQRDDRQNHVNDGGRRGALALDQLETVTGAALFAQLAAPVTGRLYALGGLRYDRFRFAADDRLVDATNPDDSGRRSMDALSPSAGLVLELDGRLRLYWNVATSFETPTTTELANRPTGAGGFNPELEPQRTHAYEVGAKGRVGGSVAYRVAAYRARVEDALIPFEVADAAGRQFFRNAGSAVHRGVEASVSFAVPDGFSGRIAYTYTDARFDAYATEDGTFDGNRVPGVAPFRFDATLTYHAPAGWFVGVDHRRLSRIPVDDANTSHSPRHRVTDLRWGFDGLRLGGVDLAPYAGVANLFDAEYNAAVTVNAFGGRYFEPAPGRSVYLGARLGFGGGAGSGR